MTYLFFGLGLLILVYAILNWVAHAPPKSVLSSMKWIVGGLVALVALVLLATGRFGLIWFLLIALLPFVRRFFSVRQMWKTMQGPGNGNRSSVKTRFLDMSLDHDTGSMDGQILEGTFKGRMLSELTIDQLRTLFEEVALIDRQSGELLNTYADKLYGDAWRSDGTGDADRDEGRHNHPKGGAMSREEALAVLGLEDGADREAVKEAHRRMMKAAHPDAGGSDYLAAKVNQAKDILLG